MEINLVKNRFKFISELFYLFDYGKKENPRKYFKLESQKLDKKAKSDPYNEIYSKKGQRLLDKLMEVVSKLEETGIIKINKKELTRVFYSDEFNINDFDFFNKMDKKLFLEKNNINNKEEE